MLPLFPFQSTGASWLAAHRYALLADEMGIGKSAQAVHGCDLIGAQRVLVICPAVARINWTREFQKFSPLDRPISIIASQKDAPSSSGVTVCSYDLASRPEVLTLLTARRFDALVCDESHFLKSVGAGRARAVLGKDGLIHRADYAWFLSGTPAPNHAGELWTLLHVTGIYKGSYDAFVRRFCTGYMDGYEFRPTGTKNIAALRALLAPIMLRRRKADVLPELQALRLTDYVVEPGDVDLIYFTDGERHPDRVLKAVEDERRAIAAVIRHAKDGNVPGILKLMEDKIATVRRYTGLAKVPAVVELATEFLKSTRGKLVLFCQHKAVIQNLQYKLSEFGAVSLYGETPAAKRQKRIDKFQQNDRCRVFIGQILAAGTNITLTAAHDVWVVEPDPVPGNNAQAIMRCHRIGQKEPVEARFFGLAGSYDERTARIYRRKTAELDELFG